MNSPSRAPAPPARSRAGFTLIELAMVIAIIVILTGLLVPAFTGIKSAGDTTSAAYTIKAVLDQARTYAMANNTYTWVGFYEEDGSVASTTPRATPGTGRLVMSIVASKDGTNVYGSGTGTVDPTRLIQVGKLIKVDNVHLPLFAVGTGTGDTFDTRPAMQLDPTAGYNYSRFGELNGTAPNTAPYTTPYDISYPVGDSTSAQYRFSKLLQFDERGEGRVNGDSYDVSHIVEIGLTPTRGSSVIVGSTNLVALQLSGFSGTIRIYRK